MRQITDGLRFPEGPIALSDGSVLLVEIQRGTLTRVAPDGTTTVVGDCGGGPNGAAIGPDGAVYVCNNGGFEWHDLHGLTAPGHQPAGYTGGRVQRVTMEGAVTELYTEVAGHPLRGPNDIVFDEHGGFYFTDLGKTRDRDRDRGGLYYGTVDGSRVEEIAYPLTEPNGVGLSPDGSRVYVSETVTGRVWYWDIDSPGRLRREPGAVGPGGARLLHGFSGYQPLDSLAVDSEGNVCVATLVAGAISVLDPDGELKDVVTMPEYDVFVTNICFGGPDLRTAYITSSGLGRLYAVEWPRPGLRLNFNT
ncbi:SMP-30/gluconolactonase/LRE family protein [Halostreptopolyspora alba]|uniref:SMP-30/gluconolactonase/LRE family protein n=1 Tax=Halostreptopolyspora alba TaxID=2487137 RepID=A0A3N0EFR5_9ACTN|nr:SMP-30/gluconolactonase/LRE family protein [Nocardiopsaceae bacterium YIM 96095]